MMNVNNATNSQNGETMVLYQDLEGGFHVREQREFEQKFVRDVS